EDLERAAMPGPHSGDPESATEHEGEEDERDPEPDRVAKCEECAAARGSLPEAERRDRGERRADARGPREAERDPEQRGSGWSGIRSPPLPVLSGEAGADSH